MAAGPQPPRDPITVSDGSNTYSKSGIGPTSDAKVLSDTPPPSARWGQEVPETTLRPTDAPKSNVPDFRKVVRSEAEVAKERPRELPAWFGPAVGVVTFVVVMAIGLGLMTVWFSYKVVVAPAPEVVEPTPVDELDGGIPVRKGLKEH